MSSTYSDYPEIMTYEKAIQLLDQHIVNLSNFIREKTNENTLIIKKEFIPQKYSKTLTNVEEKDTKPLTDTEILLDIIKEKQILEEYQTKYPPLIHQFEILLLNPQSKYYILIPKGYYVPPKFAIIFINCFNGITPRNSYNFEFFVDERAAFKPTLRIEYKEYASHLYLKPVFDEYKKLLKNCCDDCCKDILKPIYKSIMFTNEYKKRWNFFPRYEDYSNNHINLLYYTWMRQVWEYDKGKKQFFGTEHLNELVTIITERCAPFMNQ